MITNLPPGLVEKPATEGQPKMVVPKYIPAGVYDPNEQKAIVPGSLPDAEKEVVNQEKPSTWSQFKNNFNLAKDEIEKDMWKGIEKKSELDPTSLPGMVKTAVDKLGDPDFFKERIAANEIDIAEETKKIYTSPNEDPLEYEPVEVLTDPYGFFGTTLPKVLGGMAGLAVEPMIVGATAAGIAILAGSGPVGISLAGGIAGMAASRPFESVAEAQGTYDETLQILSASNEKKPDNQKLSAEEINKMAEKAFNYTYNKNLQLQWMDGLEVAAAVVPFSTMVKPFAKSRSFINRVAGTLARSGTKEFLIKEGLLTGKEGIEELYQKKISNEAINTVVDNENKKKTDWSDLFNDPEAMAEFRGGLLGGAVVGGPGLHLLRKGAEAMKIIGKDISEFSEAEIKEQQDKSKLALLSKALWYGNEVELRNKIEILGKSGALNPDPKITGKDAKKASIKKGNEIISEITDMYDEASLIKKANPKIKDQDNFTLALKNYHEIKQLKEQDKILKAGSAIDNTPKAEGAKPILSKEELKINELAKENEKIFSGQDVYSVKKNPVVNTTPASAPTATATVPPVASNVADLGNINTGTASTSAKTTPTPTSNTSAAPAPAPGNPADLSNIKGVKGPEVKNLTVKERIKLKKENLKENLKVAESRIVDQEKIVAQVPKIDAATAFDKVDEDLMNDSSELGVKAKAETDKNNIHSLLKNSTAPATAKQIRALENLEKTGALDSYDDSTKGAASESIQLGLRRLWYLEHTSTKSDEIEVYNNARKAIMNLMFKVEDKEHIQKSMDILDNAELDDNAPENMVSHQLEYLNKIFTSNNEAWEREKKKTRPREAMLERYAEIDSHITDAISSIHEQFTGKFTQPTTAPVASVANTNTTSQTSKPAKTKKAAKGPKKPKAPKKETFKAPTAKEISEEQDVSKLQELRRKVGAEILNRKTNKQSTRNFEIASKKLDRRIKDLVSEKGFHPGDILQWGGYGKYLYVRKNGDEYVLQDLKTLNAVHKPSLEHFELVTKTKDTSLSEVPLFKEQEKVKEAITSFGIREDVLTMTPDELAEYMSIKNPGEVIAARVNHALKKAAEQRKEQSVPKASTLQELRSNVKKTFATKAEAMKAAADRINAQKSSFFGLTDVAVVKAIGVIIDNLLAGAIAIQEASKKIAAILNGTKMIDTQKAIIQARLDDYLNRLVKAEEIINTKDAGTKEYSEALDLLVDASEDSFVEAALDEFQNKYAGAEDKQDAIAKKVRLLFVKDKKGVPVEFKDDNGNIIGENSVKKILWEHAKTVVSEKDLLSHYSKLPYGIGDHFKNNLTEGDAVSLHNVFKSTIKHYYVHALNQGGRYILNISNILKTNEKIGNELTEKIKKHFLDNKIEERFHRTGESHLKTANVLLQQINYKSGRMKMIELKPEMDAYFKQMALAMKALTGVDEEYWIAYQKNNAFKKNIKGKFVNVRNGYEALHKAGYNTITSFLLKNTNGQPVSFQQFYDNLFKDDPKQNVSQIQLVANAYVKSKKELISRFKNVIKKQKSTDELVSHLTQDIALLNTPEMQNSFRAQNNIWVKMWSKDTPKYFRMDGIKNLAKDKAIDASKTAKSDILHFELMAFLDESLNIITPSNYFQHFEQQSDNNSRTFIEAKRYSAKDAELLLNGIKDFEPGSKTRQKFESYIEETLAKNILRFVKQGRLHPEDINYEKFGPKKDAQGTVALTPIFKQEDALELAKHFAYNFAVNKYYIDQFFYPEVDQFGNKNYKGYTNDQVKRKLEGSGFQLNFDIMRDAYEAKMNIKLDEKNKFNVLNSAIINDPQLDIYLSKHADFKGVDLTDGFILMIDTTGDAIERASGNQLKINQQIKSLYSKNNADSSRTYLKGNTIVISPEIVERFSEKDKNGNELNVLAKLYDWMVLNKLDIVNFKSSAKKAPAASQNINENGINWTFDSEGNLRIKGQMPAPKIERLDIRYYLIQQDLRQSDAVKSKKDSRQHWYHMMKFGNSEKIQGLLNNAMKKYIDEIYTELINKPENQQKEYFKKILKDTAGNKKMRRWLSDPDFSINNFQLRRNLNYAFSNIIEDRVLGIKVPGGVCVSVPNLWKKLDSAKIVDGKVEHGQALLPEGYRKYGLRSRKEKIDTFNTVNAGLSEEKKADAISKLRGDYAFISRVPSTELHSTSLVEIVDWMPKSMGSVMMTDQGTSKIAGEDYDGDPRHIWLQYRDNNGNVITGDSYKGLMNKAFEMEKENYDNPENFERIVNPINTSDVDKLIEKYKSSDDAMKSNLPNSLHTAILNNEEGQIVIGILVRANAVYNFLKKAGARLKKPITVPVIRAVDKTKKSSKDLIIGEKELYDLNHSEKNNLRINATAANDTNHATDNVKLGNLEYLGFTQATALMNSFLQYFGLEQETVVMFMHNPVVKDYINYVRESRSPNSDVEQNEIYKRLAEYYLPGSTIPSKKGQEKNAFDPFLKLEDKNVKLTAAEWIGADLSPFQKIKVLKFLQYANSIASEFSQIGKLIKAIEDGIKNYAELLEIEALANKKLGAASENVKNKDSKLFLGNFNEIEFTKPILLNIEAAKRFYSKQIIGSEVSSGAIERLKSMILGSNKNNKDLTYDQLDLIVNGINNYALNAALQITETNDVLTQLAADWYNNLSNDSVLKKLLTLDKKGKLEVSKELKTSRLDDEEVEVYRKAFESEFKDNPEGMLNLIKYHVRLFGYGDDTSSFGGFSQFFSMDMDKLIGKRADDVLAQWNKSDQIGLVNHIARQVYQNNPALIQEVQTAGETPDAYLALTENGDEMGIASPEIIRSKVNGYWMILTREKAKRGGEEIYVYDTTKGKRSYQVDKSDKLNYQVLDPSLTRAENSTTPEFDKLPGRSDKPTMTYAGVGSRKTPAVVLEKMTEVAKYLESLGYTLNSGGAIGADKWFEKGVKKLKNIFPGTKKAGEREHTIALEIHENPDAIKKNPFIHNLQARNTNQVFGENLDTPVDFVLAWTPNGETKAEDRVYYGKDDPKNTGGTGQAIALASKKGIPVINMFNPDWKEQLKKVINNSKLKNQSQSNEKSAKSDPKLQETIRQRLSKAYPNVKVFNNAKEFQEFLDKNFPGQYFDPNKLGAAIGNAVMIDPESAVQSTQIHEHAHIYWDSIPDNDPVKQALLKMYYVQGMTPAQNEEAAIQAIGESGVELVQEQISNRLKSLLKQFWAKVKALFGKASKAEVTKLFAADVLSNKKRGQGLVPFLKYQSANLTPIQTKLINTLQNIRNLLYYPDGTKIKEFVTLKGVTAIIGDDPDYAFDPKGVNYDKEAIRGIKMHNIVDQVVKGVALKDIDINGVPDLNSSAEYVELWGNTPIPDAVVKKIYDYVTKFVNEEKAKGNAVLTETYIASANNRAKGIVDVIIIDPQGNIKIRDWKFSPHSKKGDKYNLKTKKTNALQQAIYALLLQKGDSYYQFKGKELSDKTYANFSEIDDLGVIPGKITEDVNGDVIDIEFEDVVSFKYQDYILEANRVLSNHVEFFQDADADALKNTIGFMKVEEYATSLGHSYTDYQKELQDLRQLKLSTGFSKLSKEQKRMEKLAGMIRNIDKYYAQYIKDFKEFNELSLNTDWDALTNEQLTEHLDRISRMDLNVYNLAVSKVLGPQLKQRLIAKQGALTGVTDSIQDLKDRDPYFMAPSDMRSIAPEWQAVMKQYLVQTQEALQLVDEAEKELYPLAQKVITEAQKNFSLASKIKDFTSIPFVASNSNERYFENQYTKTGELKAVNDPTLTTAERDHLIAVYKWKKRFQQVQNTAFDDYTAADTSETAAINVGKNFWEEYFASGFFKAFASWLGQDKATNNIRLVYKDPVTNVEELLPYRQIVEKLNLLFIGGNLLNKAKLDLLLYRYHSRAEKALSEKFHEAMPGKKREEISERDLAKTYMVNATTGKFEKVVLNEKGKNVINEKGQIISPHQFKTSSKKEFTHDTQRAIMKFVKDMAYIEKVNPLVPQIMALQAVERQTRNRENLTKFIDRWVKVEMLGEREVGFFGKSVDNKLRLLSTWTYFNAMTFNLPLGLMNLGVGVYNTVVVKGLPRQIRGFKRMVNYKKAQAISEHYKVVSIERDLDPRWSIGKLFLQLSDVSIRASEMAIQQSAFLGALPKEVWDNFDNKGNVIDPAKNLSTEEIVKRKLEISDIQGKYAEHNKRNYRANAIIASFMQFKTWLPDFLNSRIGSADKSIFGEDKKGTLRSWFKSSEQLKQAITMNPDFWKAEDIDSKNIRANIRGMMILGTMFVFWAAAHGDDDDKKLADSIWRVLSQIGLIYNMKSLGRMLVAPSLETLNRLIDLVTSIVTLDTFKKDSQYGKKGQLKAIPQGARLLPYGNITRPLIKNYDYGNKE